MEGDKVNESVYNSMDQIKANVIKYRIIEELKENES